MELKKFKNLNIASNVFTEVTSNNVKVEIVKDHGSFVVCIDGLEVESFKTEAAANEAASDAINALENDR